MKISTHVPTKDEFYQLYQTTGWNKDGELSEKQLHQAIKHCWYSVSAYENEQLIGYGRIISDGVYQALLCDLIVHPSYQGRGIGKMLLNTLIEYCRQQNIRKIQLFCATGKKPFYDKIGFVERLPQSPGMELFL
ncbi:GNAT family N-acetyltransferase [Bacillus alkalicellulosilyticus]|uniref:GNAT family N-acetyltransferase n=1 Tax=Alkalihalobacterium alkalicellulosilyticum TaxID=1912214 RepID=UPI000997C1BF|nr:GNAT family N-acetyltransferase [Bacillus alkalicellulosilyticus]